MRLTVMLSILITLQGAHSTPKSCSHNELCINVLNCPLYKQYASTAFRYKPLFRMAKFNQCNRKTNYVCCPSVINSRNCGVLVRERISNGEVAKPFEFPWMALLAKENGEFFCGGTLISSRYVLTAAHCASSNRTKSVRLGENNIETDVDCIILDGEKDCAPPHQDIKVEKTIIHASYSDRYKRNDIALLRLERPAKLGHSVRTICLPNGSMEHRAINPPSLIVSGWGRTENGTSFDVLRFASLRPVSRKACAPIIRNLTGHVKLHESHVCAGGVHQKGNCVGDSGGPLHYSSPKGYMFQYGVVSFGATTCGTDVPGVYTKVVRFISWIMEHVDE